MPLFSWLHKRLTGRSQTQRTPARKPTARLRPQLEMLEDRDVPSTLTVTNSGAFGAGTLRAEIAAANPGDTINFAPSLDGQTINLASQYGQLSINKNLNIEGPGAGLLAIRPAPRGNVIAYPRILDVATNVTLTLSGLTLESGGGTALGSSSGTGGWPTPSPWDGYGGAILNFGTLTVTGCNLMDNSVLPASTHVMYGGAIYNAGTLSLAGSTLSGNSACFFSAVNYAGRGGAIYNAGSASINGCTLTDNTAGYGYSFGQGGAIFNAGPLTLGNCTLSDNSASWGGGIYIASAGSAVTVSDDTLDANSATIAAGAGTGMGGGLYVVAGTVTLTTDTVQSNKAASAGGGMYIGSGAVVHLDAFTAANVTNNTAPTDPNIDGSFLMP